MAWHALWVCVHGSGSHGSVEPYESENMDVWPLNVMCSPHPLLQKYGDILHPQKRRNQPYVVAGPGSVDAPRGVRGPHVRLLALPHVSRPLTLAHCSSSHSRARTDMAYTNVQAHGACCLELS